MEQYERIAGAGASAIWAGFEVFLAGRERVAWGHRVRLLQDRRANGWNISMTHGEKIHQSMLALLGMVDLGG